MFFYNIVGGVQVEILRQLVAAHTANHSQQIDDRLLSFSKLVVRASKISFAIRYSSKNEIKLDCNVYLWLSLQAQWPWPIQSISLFLGLVFCLQILNKGANRLSTMFFLL